MTHQQALDGLASERYLLDEMTEVERFEFEAHYFDCVDCAEDVRLGERIRQEARRAGATMQADGVHQAKVLTSARWWRRPMIAAPWAVAATLALVASYQSLVTVPTLREAVSPQALEPVMLRGATRGAATTLAIARGQQFVALSPDLLAAPQSSTLSYEILDSNRQPVVSGQAQAPSSGAALMLLVPVAELQRAGRYTLILRAADQNTSLGEYDFDVSY
jgi:anti-sigma factor RsiW